MMRIAAAAPIMFLCLTACEVADPSLDQASAFRSPDMVTAQHRAGDGVTYSIGHTFSANNGSYGVMIEAVGGPPLTDDATGDRRAQNAIRDYFNADVCSPGYFAGITAIRYRPEPQRRDDTYGARLFCSPTRQADI